MRSGTVFEVSCFLQRLARATVMHILVRAESCHFVYCQPMSARNSACMKVAMLWGSLKRF